MSFETLELVPPSLQDLTFPQSYPTFDMWWSFAPMLGLFAVPVPAFAAHPQCQLVLATRPVPPTPTVHPQSSHGPSSVSGPVKTSVTSTPTPTPFVPFAYGSTPIRGVNLYVPSFLMPGSAPLRPSDFAASVEAGLYSRYACFTNAFRPSFGAHINVPYISHG